MNAAQQTPDAGSLCHLCERAHPPFQLAVAYGAYEGTLRALIHLLKYERISTVAAPLGKLLANAIARRNGLPSSLVVIAVPLHAIKQHERGFNQTFLLAEATVRSLRKQRPDLELYLDLEAMGRQRATENQSGLTPHQRRRVRCRDHRHRTRHAFGSEVGLDELPHFPSPLPYQGEFNMTEVGA